MATSNLIGTGRKIQVLQKGMDSGTAAACDANLLRKAFDSGNAAEYLSRVAADYDNGRVWVDQMIAAAIRRGAAMIRARGW